MRVFNVKCGEGSELGFIGQVGTWGKKKRGRVSFILNRVKKKKGKKNHLRVYYTFKRKQNLPWV